MEDLKNLSEAEELSYDESHQVDSIDHIKVVDVERKEGWVIDVDLYVNSNALFFDDVLYHMYHQLKKHIGMNSVNERNVIDMREFGPGIDLISIPKLFLTNSFIGSCHRLPKLLFKLSS